MRIKTLVILVLLLIMSNLSAYQWPVKPQDSQHGINATLGEWRSGHFHAGVDINESLDSIYCPETSIVDSTELKNNWIGNFRYWHANLLQFNHGDTVPSGVTIGYIFGSHLHFRESSSRLSPHDALNPLRSGALTPYIDLTNPHIDSILFYRQGASSQSSSQLNTDSLNGRVDIVSVAGDTRTDTTGHSAGHNVSVYRIGYEVTDAFGNTVKPYWEKVRFDSIPSNSLFGLVYATGSTDSHFRYYITNDPFNPDPNRRNWYWNTKQKEGEPDSVDADSKSFLSFIGNLIKI